MESLEKSVRELSGIIEKEFAMYKAVFDLVKKQKGILVNADLVGLDENIREQQMILSSINKLEEKRLQKLEVIGIYLGVVPEQLKLTSIIENSPKELSGPLGELERKFKSVIQEILNINKSNKYLINRSLQFIDKNIQVFYGAMEEKGVYVSPNSKAKTAPKNNNLLDRKV